MRGPQTSSRSSGPNSRGGAADVINSGLFQRPKEAPAPVIYVGVASVDDAIKKVQAAG